MYPVVIDIETVPSDAALAMTPPEEWLTKGIKDNFKPETVERYRAENEASWGAEIVRRASLDWRLGQIIAVGVTNAHSTVCSIGKEGEMLRDLWSFLESDSLRFRDTQLVGFNIRGFDWPWIVGRSAVHVIKPSVIISESRYVHRQMVDWMDVLSTYGGFSLSGWNLERYADLFNLDHRPVGSGADVYAWHTAGNTEAIRQHLEGDLLTTWDLDAALRPVYLGC